jgi:hypothetical protein
MVQRITVQCSAVQCSAVQCCVLLSPYTPLSDSDLHTMFHNIFTHHATSYLIKHSTVQYRAPYSITRHHIALHYIARRLISSGTLQLMNITYYITLHNITSDQITTDHITSDHDVLRASIVSYRIVSHRIESYHIIPITFQRTISQHFNNNGVSYFSFNYCHSYMFETIYFVFAQHSV